MSYRSSKIEVTAIIREVREASLKITDGTMVDFPDKRTGEIQKREVWHFLPKSQVEIEGHEMEDAGELVGKTVTLLVPEWLCEEKGLVPLTGGSGERKWTLADGIAEVKRELGLRERVYPTFIARASLSEHEAARQMRDLQGTLKFLVFCASHEAKLKRFFEEGGVL